MALPEETVGLFATDIDGTLLNDFKKPPEENIRTLRVLGDRGVVRVAVTGRSLETARRVLTEESPLDYLVFSSGAGVCTWPDGVLLHENHMPSEDAQRVLHTLRKEGLSFMAQLPIPHNHKFYYEAGIESLRGDFHMRLEAYMDLAKPLDDVEKNFAEGLSQFIVTIPEDEELYHRLHRLLRHKVEVIRATSPFDGRSIWMEIFPIGVSKGSGLWWLCEELGISEERVCVVGNDYNDLSMLRRFPRHAYVVANAPSSLREEFQVVGECDEGGMAEAARLWWAKI